jgi:hypothetical protein
LVIRQKERIKIMTRRGKIARLPGDIRVELNRRLRNGKSGGPLLAWLHSLPEVTAVLAEEFGGTRITKQSLSEWRKGGYKEWEERQVHWERAQELVADVKGITTAKPDPLAGQLCQVMAVRYASALAEWNGKVTEGFSAKLKAMRSLCQDIVELRRGDQNDARLSMEQERLNRDKEVTEEEAVTHFERWLLTPEIQEAVCQNWTDPEDRKRRLREIFGRSAEDSAPEEDEAGQDESDLVRVSPT